MLKVFLVEDEIVMREGIKNKRGLGHILVTGELADKNDPSGFGLFNVDQRIHLNYGTEYGLEIDSVYGEWTEARAVIPAVKK